MNIHKKYHNIILMVAVLLFAMIMTGCSQTTTTKNTHVGVQGLIIEFSKSNPKSVYEHEEFGTALFIRNMGTTDVTNTNPATLKVSYDNYRVYPVGGYFDEYRLSSTKQSSLTVPAITLTGRSQYFPVGEEKATAFYFVSNSLTKLREGATTTINYNLCYPYNTTVATMTCIDTNTAKNNQIASACKSEPYNGASGQGAPIVVTRIEPEILLQNNYVRPQFKIYIENKGDGYVTSNHRCDDVSLTDREFLGRVNVEAWLSEDRLECGPDNSGSLKLVDSESFIRCSLPQNTNEYSITEKNYITPLLVNVFYTYTSVNDWSVDIKHNDAIEDEVAQGICGSYEVEYGSTCVTKCEYCASHPGDGLCRSAEDPNFNFNSNFKCGCDLATCNSKESKGSCIKGYCPGSSYCCSTVKCDAYQVEYEGECVDKCWYCNEMSTRGINNAICGAKNYTGFACMSISATECGTYATKGACVKGFCGGNNINKYCANLAVSLAGNNS